METLSSATLENFQNSTCHERSLKEKKHDPHFQLEKNGGNQPQMMPRWSSNEEKLGSFQGFGRTFTYGKMQNGERRENSGAKAALGLWNEQKKV